MEFVKWDQKYNTNNKEIDEQHKKWVELVNRLYNAMLEGNGANALNDILDGLVSYANEHFIFEEKLLRKNNFKNLAQHTQRHQEFMNEVNLLIEKNNNKLSISEDIVNFIKFWLLNHILREDKEAIINYDYTK